MALQYEELKASQMANPPTYGQQGEVTNAVNTSQPNPATVNVAPYTESSQQMVDDATASGPAPQDLGKAQQAIQQFSPTPPTFYKPTTPVQGYDPATVFDTTGKPLSYDQFIAAGGKADFSNVQTPKSLDEILQKLADTNPEQADKVMDKLGYTGSTASRILKSSVVDLQLQQDPAYQQLLADRAEFNSFAVQNQSLTETYTQMTQSLGIPAMNTELMDMKKILEGTEEDIRNEISKSGGTATESQVLALTNSRNKQMVKNYNNLLLTKQMAMETLNTMVGLAGQDRAFAMETINQKLQIDQQIIEYRDKMQTNAQNTLNNIVSQVGYAGLAQMTGGDLYYTSLVEKTLGLASGGLNQLASFVKPLTAMEKADLEYKQTQTAATKQQMTTDAAMLPLEQRLKQAQIANIYSEIKKRNEPTPSSFDVKATPTDVGVAQIIASNPGEWGKAADAIDKQFGIGTATKYDPWLKAVYQNGQKVNDLTPMGGTGTGITAQVLAKTQSQVQQISGLFNEKGFSEAVGPNIFSRATGVAQFLSPARFSGSMANFIGDVEQLRSQLNLDTLIQAKAQGATFGALSDQELQVLANAATKIGSWAIIKDSKVIGYNAKESDFKKELDKINNFAKLDYVLKGGNPSDVGIQQMSDGTYWTKNSDGTMTRL